VLGIAGALLGAGLMHAQRTRGAFLALALAIKPLSTTLLGAGFGGCRRRATFAGAMRAPGSR
jgi:hypothetical protein